MTLKLPLLTPDLLVLTLNLLVLTLDTGLDSGLADELVNVSWFSITLYC